MSWPGNAEAGGHSHCLFFCKALDRLKVPENHIQRPDSDYHLLYKLAYKAPNLCLADVIPAWPSISPLLGEAMKVQFLGDSITDGPHLFASAHFREGLERSTTPPLPSTDAVV